MTSRERVRRAMRFQSVDKAPLQYYYCPVGYYEHGEKLNDLYAAHPGDFEPFRRAPISGPAPGDYDADGRYHAFRTDEWGTTWEYRIYGIAGIPKTYPLADMDRLETLPLPPLTRWTDAERDAARARAEDSPYYCQVNAGGLFEWLKQMRPDADVLCDLCEDTPEINRLADLRLAYCAEQVRRAVESGADGVCVGDDFGTERAMLISPALFRRFFKPRYRALFAPAVQAGLNVHFHSCGQVAAILPDLAEIGVTSIWPQLPAYDMETLAKTCRELGLAVAIHTDRANTMTYGTPEDVRTLVMREYDTYRMGDGGSWFYVEADNGFPFANIRALVETIALWR